MRNGKIQVQTPTQSVMISDLEPNLHHGFVVKLTQEEELRRIMYASSSRLEEGCTYYSFN